MILGNATFEGTSAFAEKFNKKINNFKKFQNLVLSNIGIGTYLGDSNSHTDLLVKNAVKTSILSGINVIDTAINYRGQKAERSVGKAIQELVNEEKIFRDQIFVSTKNGYVTNDADVNQSFWEYIKEQYTDKGIIKEGDISSGYHCMTTSYLEDQLERSLKNLGLDCVDLLYLHNPIEGQIKDVSKENFMKNLEMVFELYEQKRKEGKIKYYGLATWECFRVAEDNTYFLSLEEVLKIANKVGGEENGFRFIQLPFNLHYDQALLAKNQKVDGKLVSTLDAAIQLGIGVFSSVPFMQGRLLVPGAIPAFNDLKPSLRSLQFLRSCPGILAPLVGQKTPEHVCENLEILKIPPMSNEEFSLIVKNLTS